MNATDPVTDPKAALIAGCHAIVRLGLSHGTSGNVSIRHDTDSFYISPTGMAYEALTPAQIPRVELDGTWYGEKRPSSEWRFHRDIYKARPDIGAIVHTHARYATALASTGRAIPAFHYMVAVAGGADIRCAPYATFGTQALSDHAVAALDGRKACLLANHGMIAVGTTIEAALALAGEVENLAAQYVAALQVGSPHILDDAEMQRVLAQFATYGKQDAADPELTHGSD
jgi:L-fuculose-phosphate aldolase